MLLVVSSHFLFTKILTGNIAVFTVLGEWIFFWMAILLTELTHFYIIILIVLLIYIGY